MKKDNILVKIIILIFEEFNEKLGSLIFFLERKFQNIKNIIYDKIIILIPLWKREVNKIVEAIKIKVEEIKNLYIKNKLLFIFYFLVTVVVFSLIKNFAKDLIYFLSKKEENVKFEIREVRNENYKLKTKCYAMKRPKRIITLKSELNAKLSTIFVEKDSFVKNGDILAILDNKDNNSRFDSVKASYSVKKKEYQAAKESYDKKIISKAELDISAAEFNEVKATMESAKKSSDASIIHAPFDGYILEIIQEEKSNLTFGSDIIKIAEISNYNIECYINESQKSNISINSKATAKLKDKIMGRIKKISNIPDVYGNIRIEVENDESSLDINFDNISFFIPFEMEIMNKEKYGFKISYNDLIFDSSEKTYVKILDTKTNKIKLHEVKILDQDIDYLFIGGLLDNELVIVNGIEFAEIEHTYKMRMDKPWAEIVSDKIKTYF